MNQIVSYANNIPKTQTNGNSVLNSFFSFIQRFTIYNVHTYSLLSLNNSVC